MLEYIKYGRGNTLKALRNVSHLAGAAYTDNNNFQLMFVFLSWAWFWYIDIAHSASTFVLKDDTMIKIAIGVCEGLDLFVDVLAELHFVFDGLDGHMRS